MEMISSYRQMNYGHYLHKRSIVFAVGNNKSKIFFFLILKKKFIKRKKQLHRNVNIYLCGTCTYIIFLKFVYSKSYFQIKFNFNASNELDNKGWLCIHISFVLLKMTASELTDWQKDLPQSFFKKKLGKLLNFFLFFTFSSFFFLFSLKLIIMSFPRSLSICQLDMI